MKRNNLLPVFLMAALGAGALFSHKASLNPSTGNLTQFLEEYSGEAGISGAIEFFSERRANVHTGKYELADHYAALEEIRRNHQSSRKSSRLTWTELGPDDVGGRTRSVMVYRQNTSRVYAGAVSGGLWVSDNAGNDWVRVPLLDAACTSEEILGVGSIAQGADGAIYVGTGEFVGTGYPGQGVYKSTDQGNTFCQLPSTDPGGVVTSNTWSYVNKIVTDPTDPERVYAATRNGVRVSPDGGTTWMQPSGTTTAQAYDLEISSDGQVVHAVIGGNYYRSDDGGTSFTKMNGSGDFPNGGYNRLVMALAPTDDNYVYALMSTSTGLYGVFQSSDAGLTWISIGAGGTSAFNPPGNQGWYDLEIAVQPFYPQRVFVGGQINVWSWSPSTGWLKITGWGSRYVHPDHHVITFHPTNPDVMYIGCDGGVFRSSDATSTYPTFKEINKNYATTQFYAMAASESTGEVFGGTQDNGSPHINYTGNTFQSSRTIIGGDGFGCDISRLIPEVFFGSLYYGALRRSLDAGSGMVSIFDRNIDADADGEPEESASFYTTFELWEGVDDTLVETSIKADIEVSIASSISTAVTYDTTLVFRDTVINSDTFTVLWQTIITADTTYDTTFFNLSEIVYDTIVKVNTKPNRLFLATYGSVWMGNNVISDPNPVWYRVASISSGGSATAMGHSADGNYVYAATGGTLYRIRGLRNAVYGYYFNCADTGQLACSFNRTAAGIVTEIIYNGSGITDIHVDPANNDHIVISHGNYGTGSTVRESFNATSASPSFTVINGSGATALPAMPVYSILIDAKNPDVVYAGTEFGVFVKWGAANSWTQEIGGMEQVQVLDLRQREHPGNLLAFDGSDSLVLYLGTYGRGLFAAGFVPSKPSTGIVAATGSEAGLQVWPSPAAEWVNVKVPGVYRQYSAEVYSLEGRVVYRCAANSNTLRVPVSGFRTGVYFISIRSGQEERTGRFVVAR